jgi:hypothetical protein
MPLKKSATKGLLYCINIGVILTAQYSMIFTMYHVKNLTNYMNRLVRNFVFKIHCLSSKRREGSTHFEGFISTLAGHRKPNRQLERPHV